MPKTKRKKCKKKKVCYAVKTDQGDRLVCTRRCKRKALRQRLTYTVQQSPATPPQ